jgi:hypothetical protein
MFKVVRSWFWKPWKMPWILRDICAIFGNGNTFHRSIIGNRVRGGRDWEITFVVESSVPKRRDTRYYSSAGPRNVKCLGSESRFTAFFIQKHIQFISLLECQEWINVSNPVVSPRVCPISRPSTVTRLSRIRASKMRFDSPPLPAWLRRDERRRSQSWGVLSVSQRSPLESTSGALRNSVTTRFDSPSIFSRVILVALEVIRTQEILSHLDTLRCGCDRSYSHPRSR